MGEFWYFGQGKAVSIYLDFLSIRVFGSNFLFKASKIIGCELVRQRDMPFSFSYGSCNTFLEPNPKVLLCFDDENVKSCNT